MIAGVRKALQIIAAVSGRRRLALAFAGSLVTAFLELVGVGLVLPLVIAVTDPSAADALPGVLRDLVPASYDRGAAALLAGAVVGVFALRAGLTLLFRWWLHGFVNAGEAALATRIMDGYMRASIIFHRSRNSAELIRVLQMAVEHLFTRVIMSVLTISTEGLVVALLFAALLVLEPLIALFAVLYFGIAGLLFGRLTARRAHRVGRRYQSEHAETMQAVQEAFGGLVEMLVRGTTSVAVQRFEEVKTRAAYTKQRMHFLNELPRTYLESAFLVGIGLLVVLVVGSSDTRSGATASLALVAAVGFRVMPSLVKVAGSLTSARAGLAALDLVVDDIELLQISLTDGLAPLPSLQNMEPSSAPEVAFNDVTFVYPDAGTDDRPVLDKVDFTVHRGLWVGVIGGSGAGKTTLLLILLGLLEPSGGVVRADGAPIAQDLESWRSRIGYVPQDLFVLDGSLADNIRFGLRASDDEQRLRASVQAAALEDFVSSLPAGMETSVAEHGVRLSGGQRQRIGIARALYRRPSVLVLDEATSALDVETERSILDTLEQLRQNLTIVSVAHRLSTVRRCDKLLILEGGRITAEGSFEELVEQSDFLREMAGDSHLD